MKKVKIIEVRVSQADIKQGAIKSCHLCPIALAINRALKLDKWEGKVSISLDQIKVYAKPLGWKIKPIFVAHTPQDAREFILNFDGRRGAASPISFDLTNIL